MDNENYYNLFIKLKGIEEIMNDAIVVIDTNVLLMAYQWRDITYKRIFDALEELSNLERLKIPHQVLKEFALNRPTVIEKLYKELGDKLIAPLESVKTPKHTVETVIPSHDLISNEEIGKIKQKEEEYINAINNLNSARKGYLQAIQETQIQIASFLDEDPISNQLKNIVEKSLMNPLEVDVEEFEKELKLRKEEMIPPGYKDNGHKGDVLIWKDILTLSEKNVIFITADIKEDWGYSANNTFLGGRRELIEEFYSKNENTLKIVTPLQFVGKYLEVKGETLSEEIKDDLSFKVEDESSNIIHLKADNVKITQKADTFISDAKKSDISSILYNHISNIENEVYTRFVSSNPKKYYELLFELNNAKIYISQGHMPLTYYIKLIEDIEKKMEE